MSANGHAVAAPSINGATRMYAIVGDPIEQVKSPEAVTREFHRRGLNSVLFPLHLRSADFETALAQILRVPNLDGVVFTVPFKARALAFAQHVGTQAQVMGAINIMARRCDGSWAGDMLDGLGCTAALAQRGHTVRGKSVMLIGLGGAGGAIAAALAAEQPRTLRIHDLDLQRCERVAQAIARLSPQTAVSIGAPVVEGMDILINATPVGMQGDPRLPLEAKSLPPQLAVLDVVTLPEKTPLLTLAESCGCSIVHGREMMQAQVPKIVDFFLAQNAT